MINLPSLRGIHPRRFGLVSWSNHVPFAFDLMAELRPRIFVELGTHSGESYFAFCQAAQENGVASACYAVDTWEGDPQAGFYDESVYTEVAQHNAEHYPAFSYLLRGTFDAVRDQFADGSIDLLHIDGLHTYDAVRHDFEHWLPKVAEDGIILFHDVCVRHGDFGAWRLWEEISQNGYGVAFTQGWGLGVYRKQPERPLPDSPVLRALFSGDAQEVENVRRYYALAAENLRLRKANAELSAGAPEEQMQLQVYFDQGGKYAEDTSFRAHFAPGRWTTISVPLPPGSLGGRLRLDPISALGVVDLLGVRVTSGQPGDVRWEAHGPEQLASLQAAGTAGSTPHTGFLRLVSYGGDPQLLLPPVALSGVDEPLQLEITLRASTSIDGLAEPLRQLLDYAHLVPHLQRELAESSAQLASERDRLGLLRQELAQTQEQSAALDAARAEVTRLHAALETRLGAVEHDLRETRVQLEETEAELQESDNYLADARAEASAYRAETDGLLSEIEAHQRHGAQTREEGEGLRDALRAAEEERESLRTNLGKTDEHLTRTHLRLQAAEQALDQAREAGEADRGRLQSMRQSLSWRLTLPLRAVHRLFASRPAAKAPESVPTNGSAPHAANGSANRATPRNGVMPPRPPEADAEPDEPVEPADDAPRFQLHIDQPTQWRVPQRYVDIKGWCLPGSDRTRVAGIRVRTGDREVLGRFGLRRPDVAGALQLGNEAQDCGFEARIDLPPGASTVLLDVLDETGRAWPTGAYQARAPYAPLPLRDNAPREADPQTDYAEWVRRYDSFDAAARRALRARARALPYRPLISVVMPTYNTAEKWLIKAIESVRGQFYPDWELCIADDASPAPDVRRVLERFAALDPRIKVCFRPVNGHISAASNSALELAAGEFVALLDHDDELPPHALFAVAAELNAHPEADLIFSDEDKIDEENRRYDPYFKPDWNPDLLTGQNCISHLGVYRTERLREAGGFRVGFEGCQDWDLALRISENIPASRIRHIPRVLYHWRAIPGSTALAPEEKDYINDSSARALREHCERTGKQAEVSALQAGHRRLRFAAPDPAPLVSIIIPTRNQVELLRRCVESITRLTSYPHYEILVVDNGSDDPEAIAYFQDLDPPIVRVLPYDRPFNYSAINNFAVAQARGEVICLLNNDTEVITPDWLEEMVSQALRPEIGAVGAMLYYPDDTIQHAGVVLGLGGIAGHVFCRMPRGADGYFNRARLAQNMSAVTAACLVVRKATYLQVGGFEEQNLTVAFNDVDFCLRIAEAGYRNLWTPFAEFYHHESASRGLEDTLEKHSRFSGEVDYMAARWGDWVGHDPAYNPNLSLTRGDCQRACPPRVKSLIVDVAAEVASGSSLGRVEK